MNAYYRTGKGKRRHSSFTCANGRRALHTGDVTVVTATEMAEMAPCGHCCKGEVAEAAAKRTAAPARDLCELSLIHI